MKCGWAGLELNYPSPLLDLSLYDHVMATKVVSQAGMQNEMSMKLWTAKIAYVEGLKGHSTQLNQYKSLDLGIEMLIILKDLLVEN